MKKPMMDSEETNILASYERGEWLPVKNGKAEITRLRQHARTTLQKSKRIKKLLIKGHPSFDVVTCVGSVDLTTVSWIKQDDNIFFQTRLLYLFEYKLLPSLPVGQFLLLKGYCPEAIHWDDQ